MRSSNYSLHPVAVPVMGIVSGMRDAVIAGGARTAVGRLLGSLKDFTAADLGGLVIRAALERAGAPAERVDYVIMGQVLQAGAGQNPSRQAAVAGGIPMTVPSLTVNKVCLSGLDAIALAAQLIRAGEFDVVVAGGMESMTRAPHLLPGMRQGLKFGSAELVADEIVAVSVPHRRGEPVIFDTDEGVRADTTAEALSRLRPAFGQDGTITAGSASKISDGACAVVVMS